jgi:hypothetical protein
MIIGVVGGAVALGLAFVLVVFIGFACHGSDVSEPSDSALCTDPIPAIAMWGGLFGAPGAALLGMIVALGTRRLLPVVVGCLVSAGVLLAMLLVASSA